MSGRWVARLVVDGMAAPIGFEGEEIRWGVQSMPVRGFRE